MKNNTAMEELIEYINDYQVHLLDTKTHDSLREVRNKAKQLLEKEKRIIVEAFNIADNGGYDCPATGEQYFTNTFKKD